MGTSTFQRAFAGGELAPALHARADVIKYVTGLRTLKNFVVQRSGGAANRAGFRYTASCKTTSISVKLAKYVSETPSESVLLEIGVGYVRFFQNGSAVALTGVTAHNGGTAYVVGDIARSGSTNYYCILDHTGITPPNAGYWYAMPSDLLELPLPFGATLCKVVQNGRVLTLTSTSGAVPPHELIFDSLTRWVIRQVVTESSLVAPGSVLGTVGVAGTTTRRYMVTAAAEDTYEESEASGSAAIPLAGEPTPASPHVITWAAVTGAAEYYVYCDPYNNGTFGFIGTATGATTFNDVGFTPDFSVTPPVNRELFETSGNYPSRAGYYQQRRFFAHTVNEPDAVWASRVGFSANFGISSPLQDDDSLTFRISGNQHNPVQHLLGLKTLIILTDGGGWQVGEPLVPLTPSYLPADQETYVGSAAVDPVVVGNAILYVQSRGTIVCDLRFEQAVEGLAGRDLTTFATHLFDAHTLEELEFQQVPHSIIWAPRSDGVLLGLTYLRDQEIWGWHRHTTEASGRFEHVCVVPEADEDALYVIVRRTINGAYVRYIERLERRDIETLAADAFFVDSGLTYSGVAATAMTGLDHLEGQVVAVLADGVVVYDGDPDGDDATTYTVAAGRITLPTAAAVVHIGLPIRFAELETLDLDVQGSTMRDKQKLVGSISLLLDASSRTFYAGPDSAHLTQYNLGPDEGTNAAALFTGQVSQGLTASFTKEGRVFIRQTDPLPLTILGILPNVTLGGV